MIWLLPWEESNDVRHVHFVVYLLLAINIAVFTHRFFDHDAAVAAMRAGALWPSDPKWYQYVTHTFLHADFWHLFGNMLFLWLLGDNVEDILGHAGFLLVYFIGGLCGSLLFVSANGGSAIPTVGASGCIAAVAGAYAVLFSGRPVGVRLMFIVFPLWKFQLRAFWLLLLWFASDLVRTWLGRGAIADDEHVNFVAHGGGFAFGFVVGMWARMHGVVRRYEELPDGYFWFGYCATALEAEHRRERLKLA
ncbi:MAG TPA: rhomboid family intramembrane serine protease, partial [Xanthomonadales bacterium]|nr:rhomboid family intramembrane serine protease [Xanthomonadales bacterium]